MIFLSKSALKYAVNICIEEPRYGVLIVTNSVREIKDASECIRDNLRNQEYRGVHAARSKRFDLPNGSHIQIVDKSDRMVQRVNLVIADIRIEPERMVHIEHTEQYDRLRYNGVHDVLPW